MECTANGKDVKDLGDLNNDCYYLTTTYIQTSIISTRVCQRLKAESLYKLNLDQHRKLVLINKTYYSDI